MSVAFANTVKRRSAGAIDIEALPQLELDAVVVGAPRR